MGHNLGRVADAVSVSRLDPFLEDPGVFADLRDSLVIHMKEAVQARLPANYYAISGIEGSAAAADRKVGLQPRLGEFAARLAERLRWW
jgi:hypothetical protein